MEQKTKRYEFDTNQAYRLLTVTDCQGNNKTHDFYKDRLNCVAVDFRYDDFPSHGDKYRLNMRFVQNEDGLWCNRGLHTSVVRDVEETEFGIKLITINSIYIFEKAELKVVPYQDTAELIEVYMSLADNHYFGKGFFYDSDKNPYELEKCIHVGTFKDSILIRFKDSTLKHIIACRYFSMWNYIEFYDTIYHQKGYELPILIHNTGKQDLLIRYQGIQHVWTIRPGVSEQIIIDKQDGSD